MCIGVRVCVRVHVMCVYVCVIVGITEEEKKRTTQLIYHFREGKEVCLAVLVLLVVDHDIPYHQFHSLRAPLSLTTPHYSRSSKYHLRWSVTGDHDCVECDDVSCV